MGSVLIKMDDTRMDEVPEDLPRIVRPVPATPAEALGDALRSLELAFDIQPDLGLWDDRQLRAASRCIDLLRAALPIVEEDDDETQD